MLWRRLVQSILPYRLLTLAATFHAAHAARRQPAHPPHPLEAPAPAHLLLPARLPTCLLPPFCLCPPALASQTLLLRPPPLSIFNHLLSTARPGRRLLCCSDLHKHAICTLLLLTTPTTLLYHRQRQHPAASIQLPPPLTIHKTPTSSADFSLLVKSTITTDQTPYYPGAIESIAPPCLSNGL